MSQPGLAVSMAVAGLFAGSIVIFAAPRLVAYRLTEPIPYPSALVLVPLAGAWLARWRLPWALGVELATAAVFAALAVRFGWRRELGIAGLYCTLLVAIAFIDLDHRLVLNRLSYPGVIVALGLSLLWPGIGLGSAGLGALAGLAAFLLLQIAGRGALGTGDTKLALLIGAMRGFPTVFNALLIGVFLGAFAGLFLLLVLRRGRKSYFAYAPYLAGGAIISFLLPAN